MLTKQDLSEIKNLLQPINDKLIEHDTQFKKIDVKFEQIDKKFDKIDTQFKKIDVKFEQIDKKFDKIDTQFKTVNKKLDKLQKDLSLTTDFFDDYRVKHENRLDRTEAHLGLLQ